MTITEFARSREQQPQTISRYINRHADLFKGHTKKTGKTVELDAAAVELLDKVYPLPKPVTLIQGVPEEEHLRVLQKKDAQIQALQQKLIEMQEKCSSLRLESAENKAKTLLIEEKDKQLQLQRERADQSDAELARFKKTIFGLYKKE